MAPRSWANSESRVRRLSPFASSDACWNNTTYVPLANSSANMSMATKATRRMGRFTGRPGVVVFRVYLVNRYFLWHACRVTWRFGA